ncbi:tRNA (guanosine(46)-N7)-methyltransferase TrmB [Oscillatoria salina]|uniref:tRNA (guanosine(46)-N7)-methyltransferase TrmB n=1 Tax=Oscillatoria salina TaxID=331517 RepID=UPI001CD0157C|nr:tRNA (guanosine(46)-N7)-methyltransferase TrmB [Oscillatoria salina]MBZ8182557.1 tRNA (guanosine(46)-N7)-methyltransferase TrmB [Oscillatoria salina IIICB1]
MPRVRVRQHVNPLSKPYQIPVNPPDWEKVYTNPHHPLHLDLGCGWGEFLLQMAQIQPDVNFLGLEIREPLVEKACFQRDELSLTNLHFIFTNANTSLAVLLKSLPTGVLQRISIQFPDPWFKKRHQKRRIVQPELVDILAQYLADRGIIFLQSDVKSVAEEMRDRFQEHPSFVSQHSQTWLDNNPFPVATERENLTLSRNEPVYRVLFHKQC